MTTEIITLQVPVKITYGNTRKSRRALAVDLAIRLIEEEGSLPGGCSDDYVAAKLAGDVKVARKR